MRSLRVPLAAAAVAAVVLAGCGTTNERTAGSSPGASKSCKGADGKYTIGMSQANVAEPYRQRMDDDIKTAAKDVPQFDVKFADAAQDNAKQVADVENYITQQIDLLIISPNEAKPLTAVVKKAYDKGIPVIVLDRKVEGDAYTGFIGGDNVQIGREAGKYIAEKLLPQGGNVVELKGLAGATPQAERHEGFVEGIKGNPKVKVIAAASGDWLREKGQSQMDALLKANPKIDVVFSHNDPMAEGAYLAAKAVGREKEMKFTGIDALPIPSGGIKAVEQGRLSATFTYPTNGKEAIAAAKKILI
ncbi:MAG TPA: substrate-binding domain-containing protein, partial [Kribbella sp.]